VLAACVEGGRRGEEVMGMGWDEMKWDGRTPGRPVAETCWYLRTASRETLEEETMTQTRKATYRSRETESADRMVP
jgi:hypothetical protein